ncbi:hypothetical protein G6F51_014760 [Rhizopus arrhizus]|uniref:Secreted protein n=1 Tax=Rhizopus oryzae TaxID=64495 RepID=A0A9P6XLV4_RHIOR|nr:hypothetical protein G6F51_014760 [Rhizopus arrhizus]
MWNACCAAICIAPSSSALAARSRPPVLGPRTSGRWNWGRARPCNTSWNRRATSCIGGKARIWSRTTPSSGTTPARIRLPESFS